MPWREQLVVRDILLNIVARAVVQLDEGPRMMSNIVGIEQTPEALELDMALQVTFEERGKVNIPLFTPVTS